MRLVFAMAFLALAGCQGTKATTESTYNEKPKQCDTRAVDSGFCVPGEYDDTP